MNHRNQSKLESFLRNLVAVFSIGLLFSCGGCTLFYPGIGNNIGLISLVNVRVFNIDLYYFLGGIASILIVCIALFEYVDNHSPPWDKEDRAPIE